MPKTSSTGAAVYYQLKDWEKAKADITKALEIDEEHGHAYNVEGLIFVEEKKYDEALSSLNTALTLDPGNAFFLNNRGFVHLRLNQLEAAEDDINKSIVLNPENAWSYRNKGIFYQMKGDHENAVRLLSQALEMDESVERIHFYLATSYLQLGQKPEACQNLRAALNTNDPEATALHQKHCP